MKKINFLKIASIALSVGMFFAGCSFKAQIDSPLINGHRSSDFGYVPVLDGCENEGR